MQSAGMRCHVGLARLDVSEEGVVSIFRVERIRELGTAIAVTSIMKTLPRGINHCENGSFHVGDYEEYHLLGCYAM
jgi:hypothetical protein